MKDEKLDSSMSVVTCLHTACGRLSVDELCDQLAASLERARVAEWLACQLLAELADRFDQGAPELGAYSDVYQLARLRFDMGVRRARERVRIGRALRQLPEVSRAFVDGGISYARVREVTRVATPADERAWLELAETLPLRTLERRVADVAAWDGAKPGAKTPQPIGVNRSHADLRGHTHVESRDAVKVLDVMRRRRTAWHPDWIAEASDLPIAAVFAALFELEVQGRIAVGIDGCAAAVGGS